MERDNNNNRNSNERRRSASANVYHARPGGDRRAPAARAGQTSRTFTGTYRGTATPLRGAAVPTHFPRATASRPPSPHRFPLQRSGKISAPPPNRRPIAHTGRSTRSVPPPRPRAPRPKQDGGTIPAIAPEVVRIIPLGGVEQIGRNMTAIEYGNDIVVVDAGIQFSDEDTPGIDYLLPNIKYLEERKEKIRALVITHGHLDHIGGIPYVIKQLGNPPLYTREFGAWLIRKRQTEFPHLPELNIKVVGADEGAIAVGKDLKIRFFGVSHAIPDSTGAIIETPFGDIVMTGDVRVDNENGVASEKEHEQYGFFKSRKTLLLAMDSTGIEKPGWCISEDAVIKTIDEIVRKVPGRIIIATFASQVERIIAFFDIAKKYGKKVLVEGRSMKTNVEIIKHLKLTDVAHTIPIEDIGAYPPNKIMMIATGGQGEEFAALMRMSNKSHKYIRIEKTDTIILSSSVIPGNERDVATLKDNLYRMDAKIITHFDSDVHTSGHGKRGELEWIHRQIPYKFFMPVHGNHYMLKQHAELSHTIGCADENIVVPDNGSVVEIYDRGTKIRKLAVKAPSNPLMVDGFSIGDIQEVVIRDRQMLAQDGMFVVIASVNSTNGKLRKSPDIISRGFVYLRESQDLLHEARLLIKKTIEDSSAGMNPINFDFVKETVTDTLGRFLFERTAKRPIVIPVLIGV